jgi:hypothetical protein
MSGDWDASIRHIHAVEGGVVFAPIDVIAAGEAFDVVAAAQIGESLMAVVDCCDLFVSVRNLSRSTTVVNTHVHQTLTPVRRTLHRTLRSSICAGWQACDGDVLELIATFKVRAGVHTDYSLARSSPFIVACGPMYPIGDSSPPH